MIELKIAKGTIETLKHIQKVQENINVFVKKLINRAEKHDRSKLESPEVEIFGMYTEDLEHVEYASKEYMELLEKVKPAIEHHYSKNSHHPQFHKNGIDDMTLLDLVEMLCDWKASTERNKNGNIRKSIELNQERFNISPQLIKIFENTIKELFNE